MPKFSFEFQKKHGVETVENVELPDLPSVEGEAMRTALEIMSEGVMSGADRTGWVICVRDQNGAVVLLRKFSDLLTPE